MAAALETPSTPGFRPVPRTGVIYVMTEAARRGYRVGDPEWSNLGQGAPETGLLAGGAERITEIPVSEADYEYSRVDGLPALKEAVARLYNERYRVGKSTQYSAENVSICSGGRLALTRAVSALGRSNVGHMLPDYTAYEELLDAFGSFVPIPILPEIKKGFSLSTEEVEREILGRGLSTLLLSNPANPTGQVVSDEKLSQWVNLARSHDCSIIFDEFYSHYLYEDERLSLSAAEFVEDVNRDPIIILDGLTKNWRYPGFRVSWTLAPKDVVEAIASAGSFLDGGPAVPMQRLALSLVNREIADREARAIKQHFSAKRRFLIDALRNLGIVIHSEPKGAFYCFGDLSQLPAPLNDGMQFFEAALKQKVIVVPGEFFDINPGQRRPTLTPKRVGRFDSFVRFSFGPDLKTLERAVNNLSRLITAFVVLMLIQVNSMAEDKTPRRWSADPASCGAPIPERELEERLSPQEFAVTREDATERPFENRYWNHKEPGIYVDVVSGEPLFSSLAKYDSGTGWPSFYEPLERETIEEGTDYKLGYARTEVRSKLGNSHLGHLFDDGPKPTGKRYCINSAALRFVPVGDLEKEGYGKYLPLFADKKK
jgi:methionine-R-sulfoxide reductase